MSLNLESDSIKDIHTLNCQLLSLSQLLFSLSEKWNLEYICDNLFFFLRIWDVGCFSEFLGRGFVFSRIQSRVKQLCPVLKIWRLKLNACLFDGFIQFIYLQTDEKEWDRCLLVDIPSSKLVFTMKRHYFNMNTCRQNSPLVSTFKIKLNIGWD